MNDLRLMTEVGRDPTMNINWELVSHCQFKCSYCYFHPHPSQTDYVSVAQIVLKRLKSIEHDFKLTLLGGEPSLHPKFEETIRELSQIERLKKIYIVTNFEKKIEDWMKLSEFSHRLKIVISVHVEYPQENLVQKMIELQKFFSIDVVFNVHPDVKYLVKMKNLASEIEENLAETTTLSFMKIHHNSKGLEGYVDYPTEVESFFKEKNQRLKNSGRYEKVSVKIQDQWFEVPKFQLVDQNLNRFKGWSCDLSAYIIHYDGQVSEACRKKKQHILRTRFSPNPQICPLNQCVCDDYWAFPKTIQS